MQWEPAEIVNGSPVLFRVTEPAEVAALRATWLEGTLEFRFSEKCGCWYAIGGVDLNTKPGSYALKLTASAKGGEPLVSNQEIKVALKDYPLSVITLPPKYVQPPAEAEKRIEEEQALKNRLFSQIRPETLWSGKFRAPVATATTGVFGAARVANGVKQNPHRGLDYRARIGTTVRASNRGIVLLARNLYYEGNCVVIDHGEGLLTFYMHLSKIVAKEGETIASGQVLGLSGNTGRANGPHLHFAVRWQGSYLDPATLLSLTPPE